MEEQEGQRALTSEGQTQENRQFGNYDLIRRVDMGGMGEVYLAHQRTAFNREVAVKIIRDDLSRDALARARFFHEAEVSSHLKHDHILPLFEFGEVEGRLFLVTPYISGGTLAQRLQAGRLALEEVQQLFTALVQAVEYIHRRGVIHRDLKPGNILLDYEEEDERVYVRLIDFGIAKKPGELATPPLTKAGHEIGTVAYMAPERLNGIAAPSNDIYSLGVILYQMLTGYVPGGEAPATATLPVPLEAVVRRCLAADPGDRYASATDVLRAFEQAMQESAVPAAFSATGSIILPPPAATPLQPVYADITVSVHSGKWPASAARRRRKSLFAIVPGLIVAVLSAIAGLIYFEFPLAASASVNIGPQVQVLQQVYTITAQPSQTSIDVASSSVPAREKIDTLTGSLTGQTGQQCDQSFFFPCSNVVTPADIEILSSQLRQTLISQLSTELDGELQALHATEIGTKQFMDLSATSNPDIGTESSTVTVTLTEQGSSTYVANGDMQQLARLLLTQQLGPNHFLVNSTVQVGTPVLEGAADLNSVAMKVAAGGLEEYRWQPTQLQAIVNHIKGLTLAEARAYLQHLPGVDANLVSISIHTIFGNSNTLPYDVSQIRLVTVNPTSLPTTSLPSLPTPTVSLDNLSPGT